MQCNFIRKIWKKGLFIPDFTTNCFKVVIHTFRVNIVSHLISFDLTFPFQYLGSDLEEYSGRTVLDDDSYITLPLLHLPGVVLIPGQTLPLHLFNPRIISMMKHIIQKNRTFGMVHDR